MKKELIKSYIEWPKVAFFDALKNRILVGADKYRDTYTVYQTHSELIPSCIFKGLYYEKQIFINLYEQVKIFDATCKILTNSVFVHRYFIY